jgi:hypothetical protein
VVPPLPLATGAAGRALRATGLRPALARGAALVAAGLAIGGALARMLPEMPSASIAKAATAAPEAPEPVPLEAPKSSAAARDEIVVRIRVQPTAAPYSPMVGYADVLAGNDPQRLTATVETR